MANNVAATAGSGTTFKTTDNAGVHTGHVNVDTLPALAAGSAAIGKLAANSGVDIGDVDVTSVPADPFGVNADAASVSGSVSAKLRAMATAIGTGVLDRGNGALAATTLRTVLATDSPGIIPTGTAGSPSATVLTIQGVASMTPVATNPQPATAGGVTIFRSLDLDEGALEVVKASPGQLYGVWVTNRATTTRWIKFYDATSGTIGTGTPVLTFGIPANATDNVAGILGVGGLGIPFATGICVGASTGFADADTGAPGANDVIINVFYK